MAATTDSPFKFLWFKLNSFSTSKQSTYKGVGVSNQATQYYESDMLYETFPQPSSLQVHLLKQKEACNQLFISTRW